MRIDLTLYLFTLLTAVSSLGIEPRSHVVRINSNAQSDEHELYKRKGGGGRGGGSSRGGGTKSSGNKVTGSGGGNSNSGGRGTPYVKSPSSSFSSGSPSRGSPSGSRSSWRPSPGASSAGKSPGKPPGQISGSKIGKADRRKPDFYTGSKSSWNTMPVSNTKSKSSNAQPGSTAGGSSFAGSGPQPRFGQGGRFYGGGARTPYKAGNSRGGLAAPLLLGGAALAFWPGLWLGSAYAYNYPHHYQYHNKTTDEDESKPVICGCAEDSVCSCEENNSTLKELVGDGSYDGLNKSVIDVAKVNGTTYILVNGTLPPGTTLKDEANNQDQANDDDSAAMRVMVETLGLWPAVAAVAAAVYLV